MPFDGTSPRRRTPGPDPVPTWQDSLRAWTELAAMLIADAAILLPIVSLGALGVVLGAAGNATGAIDSAGMALLTALVTYPVHLSWAKVRTLAAGRWP